MTTTSVTPVKSGPPAPPPPPKANPAANKLGINAPTPPAVNAAAQINILSDVAAVKGTLSSVAADARAEYEQLNEAARGAFHQALNDIEAKFNVPLNQLHTLFGAKK